MSFPEAVQTVLTQKYADFSGRARRSEYWWFWLFSFIVELVAQILFKAIGVPILYYVVVLAFFVPGLAVGIRRLHDVGRSGWWVLIVFTIIGAFVLLYWYVQDSAPGDNQYGPSPKGQGFAQPGDPNAQWG